MSFLGYGATSDSSKNTTTHSGLPPPPSSSCSAGTGTKADNIAPASEAGTRKQSNHSLSDDQVRLLATAAHVQGQNGGLLQNEANGNATSTITADGLGPGSKYGTLNEKPGVLAPDNHHNQHKEGGQHEGEQHFFRHAPGEHCSVPEIMQPLISPMHHGMVEEVVIKVMDGADVTQRSLFHFWDEWKLFVNQGNVIDLGIALLITQGFSELCDSLATDIISPPLSLWATGANLENSFFVLRQGKTKGKRYATVEEAQADGAVTENTGKFLKACFNFLLTAFFLFWMVKAIHNIRREKIKPPPKVKMCNWCREDIALEAFKCKFCHSYVKDIPGIEDAGVGMFVTIKRPSRRPLSQVLDPKQAGTVGMNGGGTLTAASSSGTLNQSIGNQSTVGQADGKKIAAALARMDSNE